MNCYCQQAGRSWRASGDRQISLSASAEHAFANFRDKNTVFYKFLQHKRRFLQSVIFWHENRHFHGATLISDDLISALQLEEYQ